MYHDFPEFHIEGVIGYYNYPCPPAFHMVFLNTSINFKFPLKIKLLLTEVVLALLQVGAEGDGRAVSHVWTNLVPNSQVIVIPHPPGQPDK